MKDGLLGQKVFIICSKRSALKNEHIRTLTQHGEIKQGTHRETFYDEDKIIQKTEKDKKSEEFGLLTSTTANPNLME